MERRQWYQAGGRVVQPSEIVRVAGLWLVHTECGWVEPRPVRCLSGGHLLDLDVVGWIPCASGDRVGHRSYRCTCGEVEVIPPRDRPVCPCEERSRHRPPAR